MHENRILLPGLVRDGAKALGKASLFVLPSRFEGYPNALLEALACGLPVIATSALVALRRSLPMACTACWCPPMMLPP